MSEFRSEDTMATIGRWYRKLYLQPRLELALLQLASPGLYDLPDDGEAKRFKAYLHPATGEVLKDKSDDD